MKHDEYVYCVENKNQEIQWVRGSSRQTRYFKTYVNAKRAVETHNKRYPEDPWKVIAFRLVEVSDSCE